MRHANSTFIQQLVHAIELIVDQTFQWRDIDDTDALRRIFPKISDDWKESSLCFAACCPGGQQQMMIGKKQRFRRRHLDRTQAVPVVTVNIFADKIRKAVKNLIGFQHILVDWLI